MPQKTISLYPQAWQVRDDPGGTLLWVPTVGNANMLAAADGDKANCVNPTTLGADSDSLDAMTFHASTGGLPVFEGDARNPALLIKLNFGANDGLNAAPTVLIWDARNFGNVEQMTPFATVNAPGVYSRPSGLPSRLNIFDAMATGNFRITTIFPSRPTSGGTPSKSLAWDMATAELSYTHGANTTPNPFDFPDAFGVASAAVLSTSLVISGIDTPQLVSISGDASAVFSVNGDAFSAVARNIAAGQTLQLRMTAPAIVGNAANCVVTVETRADAWTVTAGSDVPTALNPPADLANVIPGFVVPDAIATPGQTLLYQPRGNTVPLTFYLTGSDLSEIQYSTIGSNGPWTDGAVLGTLAVGGNIWLRVRSPRGPARTGTLTLNFASGEAVVVRSNIVGPSGNSFYYAVLTRAARVIQAGDFLEWETYIDATSTNVAGVPPIGVGGMDIEFTDASAMRSLGSVCQDGLSCHVPAWTAGYNPRGQWIKRRLSLAVALGKTTDYTLLVNESDSVGAFTCRYRNVRITDSAGALRAVFWQTGMAADLAEKYSSQSNGTRAIEADSTSKRTDDTLISTGAVAFVYGMDLSPIDAFAVAGGTKTWTPAVSGAARHVSISAPTARVDFLPFTTENSNIEAGQWWRKSDGAVMSWPIGTKLVGIGYGGNRDLNYGLPDNDKTLARYYSRNPALGWDLLPGQDGLNAANAIIFVNGVAPGVVPPGWTAEQAFAAIIGDAFAVGRVAVFSESAGANGSAVSRDLRLRVFFVVEKPPEGMTWEI